MKQSQTAILPALTCIAFSSFSLHRSCASGLLPPILPVAARAAWKSFGVSAFGGMIRGSPGALFSSLGLLLFFSIFLQQGKGKMISVQGHIILAGFYNAEKSDFKRMGIFYALERTE